MLTTNKKARKQIDDLQMDFEIINPIESKKILGGYWYDNSNNGGWYDNGNGITIISNGSGGLGYNDWGTSSWGLNDSSPDYSSEWDYGSGQDQGGSSDGDALGHSLPNLPGDVPMQINQLGSCVSYAISFISNYLGVPTDPYQTSLHIDKIAALFPPGSAYERGLSLTEAKWAIEGIFESNQINTITQVNAALDANHPVIANYITQAPTVANGNSMIAHEIVIVEYNDWNYRIADSLSGQYKWISKDLISFDNGVYEISGMN